MKGLSDNPRKWTNEDILKVESLCKQHAGNPCELFPKSGDDSPTWAKLEADGVLYVWWYEKHMQIVHTFVRRPSEDDE